jgi:putative ABC transport system substrate-binding protein
MAGTGTVHDTNDPEFQALLTGLRDYGYVDGQSIQVEHRFPTDASQFSEMVNELLSLGLDVLLTVGTNATQAAQSATSTVPIVGIFAGDPLGTGLLQSLSHPGGNVTVISQNSPDTNGKRLELLHQIVPSAGSGSTIGSGTKTKSVACSNWLTRLASWEWCSSPRRYQLRMPAICPRLMR